MNDSPICPVCTSTQWNTLETKHYAKSDQTVSPYVKIRRAVLFDVWLPGKESISVQSIVCERCGFLCYSPRPEAQDIDRKYTYLANHSEAKLEFGVSKKSDAARADELFKFLRPYLCEHSSSVLDYGGGNGRLLRRFLAENHTCSIVELVDETPPEVTYLGHDLEAVGSRFDLVICSHVLEHLVEPLQTTRQLAGRMSEDGYLYVEVPNEIWGKIPPAVDPVTHINFFTSDSLRTLLESAGLMVVQCDYAPFTRPNGMLGMAVKAVARHPANGQRVQPTYRGADLVTKLADIGISARIARVLRHPAFLRNVIKTRSS